jgi:hypothetical protein
MNPTTKQIEALRNFKVPEEKIRALNIEQASTMLAGLIGRARTNGKGPKPQSKEDGVLSQVSDNLADAAEIVMDYFDIKDRSQLRDVHVALVQEMSRQVYGVKYWIEKQGILKPNGD